MAQLILSAVGQSVGGPIGAAVGRSLGAYLDKQAIAALEPARQVGPRMAGLQLTSTTEGAPMAAVFGRARVAGQVIWAARFKERRVAQATGGGKGGPSAYAYAYSLSFAVALCEGPIDGVGRVWAEGQPMAMTGVVMRVHLGGPDQAPDPLIEAIEGSAPAFRNTAYVVFEDLPLDLYANRPPQLAFEVFRRPRPIGGAPTLEDRLQGVCLIPGAGEFVYATETVLRRDGLTVSTPESVDNVEGRPNLLVSLDQLAAQLPNVRHVSLVTAWFGDDLRSGVCRVRPGVEQAEKATIPYAWSAGGVDRGGARLLSRVAGGGGPAYGGTPSDHCVVQAILELKARGYAVTLYPFVLMDVAPGNGLPDPHGGAEQAAYPWRGRISCSPAAGRPGSPDQTAEAAAEVAHLFGTAAPGDFAVSGTGAAGAVAYHGPDEWSLRRLALHYAHLAQLAGGVDSFLIGSELVGVTTVRGAGGSYPAVAALRSLAADCRAVLGGATQIGYAADWTEYYGHQPADGSGDVAFHLDPLWADPAIDFVGVDWYPPVTDWRDGDQHLDALAGFTGPSDSAYLSARIAGGEAFDWFYASPADRLAQRRTPITDGAYGEPWVFRPKDLVGWWSNAHHDRPGGVRSATPTAWVPRAKPIRLTEFGCPAVDKGGNSPNLFIDPKSAESALPPFSNGGRDDLGQRRALEATLAHFADPAANPISPVYGGAMVQGASAWCWDARPFPDFPARAQVWADAPDWALGHWLNGRSGAAPVADLLACLLQRGGIDPAGADLSGARGLVTGYVVDRPMAVADAVTPLATAYAFDMAERGGAERGGAIAAVARDGGAAVTLGDGDLALPDSQPSARRLDRSLSPAPDEVRVRFIDGHADYQTGLARVATPDADAGADVGEKGGSASLDLPIVMAAGDAARVGARLIRRGAAGRDQGLAYVGPAAALASEPGDRVAFSDAPGIGWRVTRVDVDEQPRLTLVRAEDADPDAPPAPPEFAAAPAASVPGPPALLLLDLPPLDGFEDDARPLAAVAASPWRACDVSAGPSADALSVRATAHEPATVGVTLSPLPTGPLCRWDRATRLLVRLEGVAPVSVTDAELLNGSNGMAVQGAGGDWEVIQYRDAALVAPGTWALSTLLRGQVGSEPAMAPLTPPGATVVLLTPEVVRADVKPAERGLPLAWSAAPSGGPAAGLASAQASFAWGGMAWRPFAPAHLRVARTATDDLAFSWVRRARVHGDSWEGLDPPLGEETEAYRLDVLGADGAVVRSLEVGTPGATYAAADRATDFPTGAPNPLTVEVRQRSALYGWGAPARRSLGW